MALAVAAILASHPGAEVGAIRGRDDWPDVPATHLERSGKGRDPKPISQNKRRRRAKWSK